MGEACLQEARLQEACLRGRNDTAKRASLALRRTGLKGTKRYKECQINPMKYQGQKCTSLANCMLRPLSGRPSHHTWSRWNGTLRSWKFSANVSMPSQSSLRCTSTSKASQLRGSGWGWNLYSQQFYRNLLC